MILNIILNMILRILLRIIVRIASRVIFRIIMRVIIVLRVTVLRNIANHLACYFSEFKVLGFSNRKKIHKKKGTTQNLSVRFLIVIIIVHPSTLMS